MPWGGRQRIWEDPRDYDISRSKIRPGEKKITTRDETWLESPQLHSVKTNFFFSGEELNDFHN